jgi:hypothetical protein
MEHKDLDKYLKTGLIILLVVCLGLICINQFFKYIYTTDLLNNPCKLCEKYNNVSCKPTFDLSNFNKINNLNGQFIFTNS